jgi:hypothetical protein
MAKYVMYLDEFWDELYFEIEKIGTSGRGHECVVEADSAVDASEKVGEALKSFFTKYFEEEEEEEEEDQFDKDMDYYEYYDG